MNWLKASHRDGLFWTHLESWAPLSSLNIDGIRPNEPYNPPNCRLSTWGANRARNDGVFHLNNDHLLDVPTPLPARSPRPRSSRAWKGTPVGGRATPPTETQPARI